MRALAAQGATPFLLVPRRFTVTGTEDWWRQVAQVGWLVPEAYIPATELAAVGNPFITSRVIRVRYREWVSRLTVLGIPASRLGLMLGFQSEATGRAGLQPSGAWLGVVKLQAQAGLVVSRELALSSLWSWGWGTFTAADAQPPVPAEKQAAACTYLWARDQALCDAPTVAATSNIGGFDPDLTAGAFDLAPELQCRYAGGSFTTKELTALTAAGVTSASALTALLERSLVRTRATIGPTALLRAERSVIARVFAGKRGQYQQFLQVEGATPAVARDVIRDQLLAAKVARGLRVAPITGAGVSAFIAVPRRHAHTQRRDRAPGALARRPDGGIAIPGLAPRVRSTRRDGLDGARACRRRTGPRPHAGRGVRVPRGALEGPPRGTSADARRGAPRRTARLARRRRAGGRRHGALPRRRHAAHGTQPAAAALAGAAPAAGRSRDPGARRYSMIAWVVLDIVPCQTVRPMTSSFHG